MENGGTERKARKGPGGERYHSKGRYWRRGIWGAGEGVNRWLGEGRKGTPGRKGCSAQHLVPELMKGGSWPASQ